MTGYEFIKNVFKLHTEPEFKEWASKTKEFGKVILQPEKAIEQYLVAYAKEREAAIIAREKGAPFVYTPRRAA